MARNAYYNSAHWRELRATAIKRDRGMCTVPGCNARGTHVDHYRTRPSSDAPTPFDVLTNLRTLCAHHDSQVKERNGKRMSGGKFKVRGCDALGNPADPNHPWRS